MAEKVRIPLSTTRIYHGSEKYTIEVELVGADKKDIDLEIGGRSTFKISYTPILIACAGHFTSQARHAKHWSPATTLNFFKITF